MTDRDKKLIRNSTAEFLIFTGQAGEQSIEARYIESEHEPVIPPNSHNTPSSTRRRPRDGALLAPT